ELEKELQSMSESFNFEAESNAKLASELKESNQKRISEHDDTKKRMYEENESLKQGLKDAIDMAEFYHEWSRDDLHLDRICGEATDKRAREFLEKHKDKIGVGE